MSDNLIELTDENFEQTVSSNDMPVLVDFWAPWCGPCKMIAPLIGQIADEYAGKAKVCKIDTDQHREAAVEFGISAIPTIILFKDGKVFKKWVGMISADDISEALDEAIG
jgi:thioredoxin 1